MVNIKGFKSFCLRETRAFSSECVRTAFGNKNTGLVLVLLYWISCEKKTSFGNCSVFYKLLK